MPFLRLRRQPEDPAAKETERSNAGTHSERPTSLRVVPEEKLEAFKQKRTSKRKNLWIFGLGGVFGLLLAAFFAQTNDIIDLPGLDTMNLDNLMDILPAAFIRDAQQLQVCSFYDFLAQEKNKC
jgi:phospholipid:diacylglycerol acyltransferase